jgi:hypothetical protein
MQPEWKDDGRKEARATMDKVGREILDKSKRNLQTSGEKVEKSARLKGRDILTLLLRANTATDIREHQRMSDEEVLARTSCRLLLLLMHLSNGRVHYQKSPLSWQLGTRQQGQLRNSFYYLWLANNAWVVRQLPGRSTR